MCKVLRFAFCTRMPWHTFCTDLHPTITHPRFEKVDKTAAATRDQVSASREVEPLIVCARNVLHGLRLSRALAHAVPRASLVGSVMTHPSIGNSCRARFAASLNDCRSLDAIAGPMMMRFHPCGNE